MDNVKKIKTKDLLSRIWRPLTIQNKKIFLNKDISKFKVDKGLQEILLQRTNANNNMIEGAQYAGK